MTDSAAPLRILIVDDLQDMREVLGVTFVRKGWEILEAENGSEAINIAATERPDVILMDHNMPVMSGVDACRQLKDDTDLKGIPILIYTGANTSDLREAALSAGADHFLTKPIMPSELRTAVERAVGKGKI